MPIQTDREKESNRSDTVIKNIQEKRYPLIDIFIPNIKNTSVKATEELSSYKDLEIEIERLWETKETKIPVFYRSPGTNKERVRVKYPTDPGLHQNT